MLFSVLHYLGIMSSLTTKEKVKIATGVASLGVLLAGLGAAVYGIVKINQYAINNPQQYLETMTVIGAKMRLASLIIAGIFVTAVIAAVAGLVIAWKVTSSKSEKDRDKRNEDYLNKIFNKIDNAFNSLSNESKKMISDEVEKFVGVKKFFEEKNEKFDLKLKSVYSMSKADIDPSLILTTIDINNINNISVDEYKALLIANEIEKGEANIRFKFTNQEGYNGRREIEKEKITKSIRDTVDGYIKDEKINIVLTGGAFGIERDSNLYNLLKNSMNDKIPHRDLSVHESSEVGNDTIHK